MDIVDDVMPPAERKLGPRVALQYVGYLFVPTSLERGYGNNIPVRKEGINRTKLTPKQRKQLHWYQY